MSLTRRVILRRVVLANIAKSHWPAVLFSGTIMNMSINERTAWLFHGESGTRRSEIIRWWETRRIDYNAYVGLVGFISWCAVLFGGDAVVTPGEDFVEPLAMLAGPVLFVCLSNICYTFGWLLDISLYRGGPRRALFKTGLILSIILAALPGLWTIVALLVTLYTGRKLE